MFKVKFRFSKLIGLLLVVFFSFFTVYVANSQQLSSTDIPSNVSPRQTIKNKLADDVLLESGIAQRYDMHFDHLIGTLIGKGDDLKLYQRFRKMFTREIGWTHFKEAYAAKLASDFSEDELKELLSLSKQPLMQRLLKSEVNAYLDTSKKRYKMGYELWNNYNNEKISLPLE
ncbi:MAG TPA: DUF2059 domain-containing protein [Stenomitos sp.]